MINNFQISKLLVCSMSAIFFFVLRMQGGENPSSATRTCWVPDTSWLPINQGPKPPAEPVIVPVRQADMLPMMTPSAGVPSAQVACAVVLRSKLVGPQGSDQQIIDEQARTIAALREQVQQVAAERQSIKDRIAVIVQKYKLYAHCSTEKAMPVAAVGQANQPGAAQVGAEHGGVHAVEPVAAEVVQPAATAVPEAQDLNQDAGKPSQLAVAASDKPKHVTTSRKKVLDMLQSIDELLGNTRRPLTAAEKLDMIKRVIEAAQRDIKNLRRYMQAGLAYYDAVKKQGISDTQLKEAMECYIAAIPLNNFMILCNEDNLPVNIKELCNEFIRLYEETGKLLCSQYACARNAEQFERNIGALQAIAEQLGRLQAKFAGPAAQ
jgi:hypothetical protein